MADDDLSTKQVIEQAEMELYTAKMGHKNVSEGDGKQQEAGLRNVAVFGRAVTSKLQNLRSVEPNFDDWYAPYREEMERDELMNFFYKFRTDVLKKSKQDVSKSFVVNELDLRELNPPPNTVGTSITKHGVGWHVQTGSDQTEIYYAEVPEEMGYVKYSIENKPTKHLNTDISDEPIEELCRLYVSYLANMVSDAKETFL